MQEIHLIILSGSIFRFDWVKLVYPVMIVDNGGVFFLCFVLVYCFVCLCGVLQRLGMSYSVSWSSCLSHTCSPSKHQNSGILYISF